MDLGIFLLTFANISWTGCLDTWLVSCFEDHPVRVVLINGEPWWVAKDVCTILEITDYIQAVDRLDDDERGRYTLPTLGGNQKMLCINEPGLYGLVLTSRKPEAKAFKHWLKHEVLPSIRKTGSYSIEQTKEQIFTKDVQRRCILNEKRLPPGYWCVVTEMWREAWTLEAFQKELKPSSLPDGSCGAKWRNRLNRMKHPLLSESKREYLHVPNLANLVNVWIYPDALLFEFRRWIRIEYANYYVKSYLPSRELRKRLA